MKKGIVYWITGLSGAGKTTLGTLFFNYLKGRKDNVVYLDGDVLREVFGGKHGHTPEERKQLAMNYSRLCKILADQGIDVVCATISMFHDIQEWNRKHIDNYMEIYLKVPVEVLIKRDQKQLYSRALRGEINHVMGIDVTVDEPECPDIVLENNGQDSPEDMLKKILKICLINK